MKSTNEKVVIIQCLVYENVMIMQLFASILYMKLYFIFRCFFLCVCGCRLCSNKMVSRSRNFVWQWYKLIILKRD